MVWVRLSPDVARVGEEDLVMLRSDEALTADKGNL